MNGESPGTNGGGCRRRGRGRPRVPRSIEGDPRHFRCYGPLCRRTDGKDAIVTLSPEEIEIIRLIDLSGLNQESAASEIGVSRKTLWRDLHEARRKIADALVNGKTIHVVGCSREKEDVCPDPAEEK
ncbi:MAG: DUF134 domain-containing protein [Methanomicrobiaceae archaeon]|nr:DUF134 domain-containing protein [Methanomicrobiaceae archaeon]